jgi:hypothetical protein
VNLPEQRSGPRYGRYGGVLALAVIVLVLISVLTGSPGGDRGIEPGHRLPPFAAPLALSGLGGDVNIATHAHQGAAGGVPACSVRGPGILNVCALYERAPLVLALFVDSGSCADVLGELQALAPSFPGVRFAAVAIKGQRDRLRRLIAARGLRFPVGIDRDGVLATVYRVASCPQVSFALPGGVVESWALLGRPSAGILRARIGELVGAARSRGWKG